MKNGHDPVMNAFLESQVREGLALAEASDIVVFLPHSRNRYIMSLLCKGLVCDGPGRIAEAGRFDVAIYFPADYLRVVHPPDVLTWLAPLTVHHPNILGPLVCLGPIVPGTGVVDLAFRLYDLVRYETWASHDALNHDAAQWARHHQDRCPLDRRPLMRARAPGAAPAERAAASRREALR